MTSGARWIVLALGAATFLAAAKAHGRQLRLERELAGYWHVTFGAQNPAFVEALWRRERLLYWSLAAALAIVTIGFRVLASRVAWSLPVDGTQARPSVIGALIFHVLVPLIVAFIATGFLSLSRFAAAARSDQAASNTRPQDWLSQAAWGSAGWWLLTIAMGSALCFLAWRRPS